MVSDNFGLDDKELVTLDTYNRIAAKWARTSDGVDCQGRYLWGEEMRMFHEFAKGAPSGDHGRQSLLEVGVGTGRDAKLLSKFYDYTGIDIAEKLIEIARRSTKGSLPSENFRVMSTYDLREEFPAESFDLLWVCATLLHCSKERIQEALTSMRCVLKTGAVGFISLKEGEGEELDHFDGLPRYFTYWREEEFARELEHAGFRIIAFHRNLSGRLPFLCYFATKA